MESRPRLPWLRLLSLAAVCLSPAAFADETPGARAWQRCAVCHGRDGSGGADGTFPKIAGQHASVIQAQLAAIRDGSRSNPVMRPHVEAIQDPRDVADIARLVASMPRDASCVEVPAADLARGERLYARSCARCHGETGQGNAAERVPWIACQQPAYLLRRARQLAAWGRSAHPETDPPLADWTDAELRAVVDFAARLPAEPPAGAGAEEEKKAEVRAPAIGSRSAPERRGPGASR